MIVYFNLFVGTPKYLLYASVKFDVKESKSGEVQDHELHGA
jgi:hypothetical protein